jgi:hypothetical protein
MKTEGELVDRKRILSIVGRRLEQASPRVKKVFPSILRESPRVFVRTEADYLMVAFLTASEDVRVKRCLEKRIEPFPGLIGRRGEPAAFGLEGARQVCLDHNDVSNVFAVSLGEDSSVWLEDHGQSVPTQDGTGMSFRVSLAYILSYGKLIKPSTIYKDFDDLLSHSILEWTKRHAGGDSGG